MSKSQFMGKYNICWKLENVLIKFNRRTIKMQKMPGAQLINIFMGLDVVLLSIPNDFIKRKPDYSLR